MRQNWYINVLHPNRNVIMDMFESIGHHGMLFILSKTPNMCKEWKLISKHIGCTSHFKRIAGLNEIAAVQATQHPLSTCFLLVLCPRRHVMKCFLRISPLMLRIVLWYIYRRFCCINMRSISKITKPQCTIIHMNRCRARPRK